MRFYLQTKFRGNLRGSSIFCVDLAWNDINVVDEKDIHSTKEKSQPLEIEAPAPTNFVYTLNQRKVTAIRDRGPCSNSNGCDFSLVSVYPFRLQHGLGTQFWSIRRSISAY